MLTRSRSRQLRLSHDIDLPVSPNGSVSSSRQGRHDFESAYRDNSAVEGREDEIQRQESSDSSRAQHRNEPVSFEPVMDFAAANQGAEAASQASTNISEGGNRTKCEIFFCAYISLLLEGQTLFFDV